MNYSFKFEKYPELEKLYEKHRSMRRNIVKLSMKDTDGAGEKLEKAIAEHREFSRTIVARAVYDAFSSIKPLLHNRDKDFNIKWDKLFCGTFETLNDDLRDYLAGLIYGNYIYELPRKYYNK